MEHTLPPSQKYGSLSWVQVIVSVLGPRLIASGVAFLGNVLVGRQLEPAGYGRFYMLFTVMTLVAGLTGPAIDTSLVRFAARHIRPGRDTSAPYFKFVFYVKCAILLITLGAGALAMRPLRGFLFSENDFPFVPPYAIVLAFLGGAAVSMWGFAQSYFQAHQRFTKYAGFEFCSSTLRFGLVCSLLAFHSHNVLLYLGAYVTAPLVMGIISWSGLPRKLFTARTDFEVGREFFRFARWVLLGTVFMTISQRLDFLLLGYFDVPKDIVGRYGAAVSLVLAGELVLLTFHSVLLPKASQLKGPSALQHFVRQLRIPSLLFCLALASVIPFSGLMCRIAFGASYDGMESYFNILLLGVTTAVFCAPAVSALYSLGRAPIVAILQGVRLACALGIGLWVVPRYGALGMACTVAAVRGGMSLILYAAANQHLRRLVLLEQGEGQQTAA